MRYLVGAGLVLILGALVVAAIVNFALADAIIPGGGGSTPFPAGATALANSTGNLANSSGTATLTSAASRTVYLTGFEVTGSGATAGLPVQVSVSGVLGGTMTYIYVFAAGVLTANTPLIVEFNPPIPASGPNVNITVGCPMSGAGGTNNSVNAHGYLI